MFNMLKMDLRRFFRSRGLYTALIVFSLLMIYSMNYQNSEQITQHFPKLKEFSETGIFVYVNYTLTSTVDFLTVFGTKFIVLIFGIFMSSFFCNEFNSGFIKNECMMTNKRSHIAINKFIIAMITSFICVVLSTVLVTAIGYVVVDGFSSGDITQLMTYVGVLTMTLGVFFALIIVVSISFENKAISIVMSVLFAIGLPLLFSHAILDSIGQLDLVEFTISKLLIPPIALSGEVLYRYIGMSTVYILVFALISNVVIKRKNF